MEIDVLGHGLPWAEQHRLAQLVEEAGFSGMQITEIKQPPWAPLTVTALAAPTLQLGTAVAVAFARSPMVLAAAAWELAANTNGGFRLGLGSQVRAHVERRYGAQFDPPVARMRDYVEAVRACWRGFREEAPLAHAGPHYQLSLLPPAALPRRHAFEDSLRVDVAAVGPAMTRMAGATADGVHVHPFHSAPYLRDRFMPELLAGARSADRDPDALTVIVPVFAAGADSAAEQQRLRDRAREQVAFYGTTRNYAFMFDDLGFTGLSARLSELLRAGDLAGMSALVTDEVLDHFAVIGPWEDLADRLLARYQHTADRLITYLGAEQLLADPGTVDRWRGVTEQLRAAGSRSARLPA